MRRPVHGLVIGLALLLFLAVGTAVAQEAADCRACHEENLTLMDRTYHAGLEEGCFSCHQGAEAHMKGRMEGEETPGPSLENLSAEDSNAVCMSCHETQHNPTWEGSAHARRGLRCTECHSVHNFKSKEAQLKKASVSATCYQCHTAIRAQGMRTSHHPVREGLMDCTTATIRTTAPAPR